MSDLHSSADVLQTEFGGTSGGLTGGGAGPRAGIICLTVQCLTPRAFATWIPVLVTIFICLKNTHSGKGPHPFCDGVKLPPTFPWVLPPPCFSRPELRRLRRTPASPVRPLAPPSFLFDDVCNPLWSPRFKPTEMSTKLIGKLGSETNFSTFKRVQIIWSMFSDHSGITLDHNNSI